jgi:phytoene dehydrogenase-like protein/NAD-dependent dihydropyrimidine dehydrogenase PreA subunit
VGILIDEAKCIGCGLCECCCAYNAIEVDRKARVGNDKCTDCTVCVDYCPVDAIAMEAPVPIPGALGPGEAAFDAVVIGSGVGGLSAGALLIHHGYKTLILEHQPSVGGRYSSLKHRGVMVPTGGSLIQVGGPIEEVFREVGADFDVVMPQVTKYWVRGKGWIDPGSGGGQFRRALRLASGDEEAVTRVMEAMREVMMSQQYPSGSMLEWLHSITDNKDVQGIFSALAGVIFGPEDVPAANFFAALVLTAGKGAGLARQGGIHLMGELAKAITRSGGEVWMRSKVQSIVLEQGKAKGLLVERRGQPWRIKGRVFISNAGPKQTARLVGRENLPTEYLTYLDETVIPMAGGSSPQHIISTQSLPGLGFPGLVNAVGSRRIATLFEPTAIASWGTPGGLHITEIYGFAPRDPYTHVDPDLAVQEVTQDLDDMCPGWREYAQVKLVSSDNEWPGNHTWTGTGATVETPIPNLFLVGDGCKSRKGYAGGTAAAESAQWVADLVQERFPPN